MSLAGDTADLGQPRRILIACGCRIAGLMIVAQAGALQETHATAVFLPGKLLAALARGCPAKAVQRACPVALGQHT